MGHAFEHKVTSCLTEVAGGRITTVPAHNDRVSPGHHKRPQDGGQMNSERPEGGGRDSTDVLTRTARAPDLELRYGDGAEHVADVHLPPMAVGSGGGTGARVPFTIFLHGGFWRAAAEVMGGGPGDFRDGRYLEADPSRLVPASGPVWLVHGMADDRVPYLMSLDYARWARAAGARAAAAPCLLLPGAGHFGVIDPLSEEWPQVVNAFWRVGG